MFFLVPLTISFLALIYSIYTSQKHFFGKLGNIEIAALASKVQKISFVYLFRLYRIIGVFALIILIVILSVPFLDFSTALGFIIGVVGAGLVAYISLLFLNKLNSKIADNSYKGLIESFRSILEGGNIFSVFILGLSLFIISLYRITLDPSAEDLVAMTLGATLVMAFSRIGIASYTQTVLTDKKFFIDSGRKKTEKESRDPQIVASLVGYDIEDGIGLPTIIFGIFTISITGAIIIGSSVLGDTILPSLIAAVGLFSSFIGVKLVRAGTTTNILKNIFLSVFATVLVASVILFPLLAWVLSASPQYSDVSVWLSSIFGFWAAGFISCFYYIARWKNLGVIKSIATITLTIPIFIGFSYVLAGIYAVSLFVVAFVSVGSSIVSLLVFSSATDNARSFSKITELPQESINTIDKLHFISRIFRVGVNVYTWFASVLASIIMFFLYKQEITSKATHLDFALDNPTVLASLFLGGSLIYWILYFTYHFPQKIRLRLVGYLSKQLKELRGKAGRTINPDHNAFVGMIASSVFRESILLLSIIILVPLVVSLLFGAEALGGLVVGSIILGTFLAMHIIFDSEDKVVNALKNKSPDKFAKIINRILDSDNMVGIGDSYSYVGTLMVSILSIAVFSVFLVIFLI